MLLTNADILDILDQAYSLKKRNIRIECNWIFAYDVEDYRLNDLIKERLQQLEEIIQ